MTSSEIGYPVKSRPSSSAQSTINVLQSVNALADSFGLKPFTLTTATFQEIKSRIGKSEKRFSLIPATAKFIIFSVYKKISKQQVNDYIEKIAKLKNESVVVFGDLRRYLAEHINHVDAEGHTWTYRQTSSAIDNLVNHAQGLQLESVVIRDFNFKEINSTYNLDAAGLESMAIVAIYPKKNFTIAFDLTPNHN